MTKPLHGPIQLRILAVSLVGALWASSSVGSTASAQAPLGDAGPPQSEADGTDRPEILTFGTGPETTYLVDHGDTISIYAEKVAIETLVEYLQQIGGPQVESVELLDRPVTVTLHRARMEKVLRRMLDGYSFIYHYKGGRVATVRVVGLIEGREYTVPSAIMTRSQWTRTELGEEQ